MKQKRRIYFISLLIIILFAAVFSFVKFTHQEVTQSSPKVETLTGRLVDGFPALPTYPGALLISSQKSSAYGTQPTSFQAFYETDGNVKSISQWYTDELKQQGWTVKKATDNTQATEQDLSFQKNSRSLTVNIETESGKTDISVNFQ